MKVSVVIPAYNEEKYIGKCLEALKNQEEQADEIIVIDNNCTDKTVQIARKYSTRIVKEEIQGMIPARNRGLDEAKYEIIARCDADCKPPTNWIKRIKENFKKRKIAALSGPVKVYDPFISKRLTDTYVLILFKVAPKITGQNLIYGPNFAITKKVWNKVRDIVCLDDKEVHEDFDLAFHIKDVKGRVYFDKKLVMETSSRRAKNNISSLLVDYPARLFKMAVSHNRLTIT